MSNNQANSQPNLADYHWLVTEGRTWLDRAKSAAQSEEASLPRLASALRRDLSSQRTHLVLEQVELRPKARAKFQQAGRMFLTRLGLEQATDQWISDYKAGRFARGETVADLCCGIGGDLLGLMQRGPVVAIDRNPIAAALAQANVEAVGHSIVALHTCRAPQAGAKLRVEFVCGDVVDSTAVVSSATAWHIDPDRRPAGKRTTMVELHEPGPEVLQRLLSICANGAIKLAPAADLAEAFWSDAELEWISRGRQCRQLVAWFGELAQYPGQRRASLVRMAVAPSATNASGSERAGCESFVGTPDIEPPVAQQVGRYLFEPDPAILAAKLEGALAAGHRLMAIAPGVAYFTADQPDAGPMMDSFEVIEVMPYRAKPLRQWLASRGIRRLEVKKRGVRLDPAAVRRELLAGNRAKQDSQLEISLILARICGRDTAILANRLPT